MPIVGFVVVVGAGRQPLCNVLYLVERFFLLGKVQSVELGASNGNALRN